jgi:hypothetical protein
MAYFGHLSTRNSRARYRTLLNALKGLAPSRRWGRLPIWTASEVIGEGSMDYIGEAKKFIQRAKDAFHPEVMGQHLAMADWCLGEAIKERDGNGKNGAAKSLERSPLKS